MFVYLHTVMVWMGPEEYSPFSCVKYLLSSWAPGMSASVTPAAHCGSSHLCYYWSTTVFLNLFSVEALFKIIGNPKAPFKIMDRLKPPHS